ncbi:hypothetical protein GPECTOR_760g925 [Gonium pectorale]|uniref:Uncharacterized protein n=1 Tax=Gonium pectorale TaxID=33097 RepID=A0A150FVA7_GONPE|nr:hypothetical protein GPECTOR_760g925 [Gonium pectorale]|eukprot:KXZ41125.1 hypothetical protein GPECTOR_760g925 [Gonium pectorale]
MAGFRALGYSVAEVWSAVAGGGGGGGPTLLHAAASSGDVPTLRMVAAWAAAAGGGGSVWALADGDGVTPLHVLAARATSADAVEWALAAGGDGARAVWSEAADARGLTPAELAAGRRVGWTDVIQRLLVAQAHAERTAEAITAARAGPSVAGTGPPPPALSRLHVRTTDRTADAAVTILGGGGSGGGGASTVVPAASGAGEAAASPRGARTPAQDLPTTATTTTTAAASPPPRSTAASAVAAALACGFPSAGLESRYQAFLTARSAGPARGWAVLHGLMLVAALARLAAEGQGRDCVAAIAYSAPYLVLAVLLFSTSLYASHRSTCWAAVGLARAAYKAAQVAGLLPSPAITARFVRSGATTLTDAVLPALFEPYPLRAALLIVLYDTIATAAYYRSIGYAPAAATAAMHAATKGAIAAALRLVVDAAHRAAFLRALLRSHPPPAAAAAAACLGAAPAAKAAAPDGVLEVGAAGPAVARATAAGLRARRGGSRGPEDAW